MILDNPFHVLGLTADCSARNKARRESQVKAYLSLGKRLAFEDDLYFDGCRRNRTTVERALSSLQDPHDRIGYGLFWFSGSDVLSEFGMDLVVRGDLQGAIRAWERVEDRPPTLRTAPSLNNLGTACLLLALTARRRRPGSVSDPSAFLHRGVRAKSKLVGRLPEPDLSAFCATFSDKMAARNADNIVAVFGESLEKFKAHAQTYGLELSTRSLVSLLEPGGPRTADLSSRFVVGPRKELERAIRACEAAYEDDASRAATAGKQLMAVAKVQLAELATLLSTNNFQYTSLADRVASELLDAAVAHHNYHADSEDIPLPVARGCLSLVRYSGRIACGVATRRRAQENLETVEQIAENLQRRRDMALVREPITEWMQRSSDLLEADAVSSRRIAFVKHAVDPSASAANSALHLLSSLRDQGIRSYGTDFRTCSEMVDAASIICRMLVSHLASAHNSSDQISDHINAANVLQRVAINFVSMSVESRLTNTTDAFVVDDGCFAYLTKNVMLANKFMKSVSGVPATNARSQGCLSWVIGVVSLIALLFAVFC